MKTLNSFRISTFLGALWSVSNVWAQLAGIPIGTWRTHNSYFEAQAVELAGNKVWTGTSGGLFYLDKDDLSINKLTKIDGLSGLNITALKYDASRDFLLIGYTDGNLDIIKKGIIYNNTAILKSNKSGLKKINHISMYSKYALISCDFGAVLFDLDRMEIKESYLNIGSNGSSPRINASALKGDSVFLATSNGIYTAKSGTANLIDFKNWKLITTVDTLTSSEVSSIAVQNNFLYFGVAKRGIYSNRTGIWTQVISITGKPDFMTATANELYVSAEDTIIKINGTSISYINGSYSKLGSVVPDPDGSLWYADSYRSLVKYKDGNIAYYMPNGPFYNQAFAFYHYKNKMVAVSGGFTGLVGGNSKYKGYYEFENNEWSNYIPGQNTGWIADATSATYSPLRNTLYIGTANEGVMAVNQSTGAITYINDKSDGCKLHIAAPIEFPDYINVRAVAVYNDDNTGNVWICNPMGTSKKYNTIFVLKPDNTCTSYGFPGTDTNFPIQLLVDDSGNKWFRPRGSSDGGVYVFNETVNAGNPVYLSEGKGAGNLSSNRVNCMIKDRNGDIWVGTNQGVCVFYSPGSITTKKFDAVTPVFQNRPLLFDQVITCIDVDGGNRKWIGTTNGLYLFNSDGTQVIHYFNIDNSPLFSNNIVSVKADPKTGEVFIGTDVNIVSFREAATTGMEDTPEGIDIFPNPISQNFTGQIGFAGLATDAIVKIVDISGNKVYETKANGGAASWNARDYKGRKISPGVYVVLTSKEDGSAAVAGKLFVTE